MKQTTLKELKEYLDTGCSTNRMDVPDHLIEEGFVECGKRSQIDCPHTFCDADARPPNGVGESDEVTVVCNGSDSHTTTIEKTALQKCSLKPEPVLDALCNHLGVERDGPPELHLPSYIATPTASAVTVCLITDPTQEEETAEQIVRDAVQHSRVMVLLSLKDTVDHIIDIIDRYAMAAVRPYPFSNLGDTEVLRRLMRSATISRERKLSVQELYELDEDDLLVYLGHSHPFSPPGVMPQRSIQVVRFLSWVDQFWLRNPGQVRTHLSTLSEGGSGLLQAKRLHH